MMFLKDIVDTSKERPNLRKLRLNLFWSGGEKNQTCLLFPKSWKILTTLKKHFLYTGIPESSVQKLRLVAQLRVCRMF